MMEIKLRVILSACIVNFVWMPIHSHTQRVNQFRNIFNSVATNDLTKSKIYGEIVEQEVAKERSVFAEIKNELLHTRIGNLFKKGTFNKIIVRKREINENENNTARADSQNSTNTTLEDQLIYDEEKLEKIYLQLHPNIKNIPWPEAENLTAEVHKRVCDQILEQIDDSKPPKNYTFLSVPSHRLQSERVMRDPLLGMYSDVAHPIVIQCFYDKKKFYITNADKKHVFRVNLSRGTHVFDLASGLHPVTYTLSAIKHSIRDKKVKGKAISIIGSPNIERLVS